MAYPKINRPRKYKKKKHHPLATACITILFCIGISLGLAAFWQKYDKNLTGLSKEESSIASEPLSSSAAAKPDRSIFCACSLLRRAYHNGI